MDGERYAVIVVYREDGEAETKQVTTDPDRAYTVADRLKKDSVVVLVVGL